jgi:hypothetical protein
MAEYYPLLAKAIAALPNSTPETRGAVYERARKALLGQLQNLQPPIPAADLARETAALDAAIARLEAESGGNAAAAPVPQPPRPAPRPAAPPRPATPPRPPIPAATPPSRVKETPPVEPAATANGSPPSRVETPPPPAEPKLPPREPSVEPQPEPRARLSAPARPMAPQPDYDDAPMSRRLWIVIGVVVLVVAGVAIAAWKLRDHPDQLSAFNKPAQQTTTDKTNTKDTRRVGGGVSAPEAQAAPPAAAASPSSAPAAAPAETAPAAPSATPAAPAAAAAPKAADTNSSLPIAYRAALLVEAPEEQSKVKTYVGTVIWKLQNVSNGPGQPLATAVHADIDVPDDKLKVTVDIQKNTDPSLSASHTITIVFSAAPDSPTGGVKDIRLPQLREEDNPVGQPLSGIVVPIMDNSFLVGLSRGDAEAANIDLLKKLEWIDIPMILNNGRVAKLTFEKNTSGSRAIDEALASWEGQ